MFSPYVFILFKVFLVEEPTVVLWRTLIIYSMLSV